MEEKELERVVMDLIVHAGNGRSKALEAIRAARSGDFGQADALLDEAGESLLSAHEAQSGLIRKEITGDHVPVSLVMVHAQDHLMNALTVKELAIEMIEGMRARR